MNIAELVYVFLAAAVIGVMIDRLIGLPRPLTAVAVILILMVGVVVVYSRTSHEQREVSAQIQTPPDGGLVPGVTPLSGDVNGNLAEDHQLWAVLRGVDEAYFHPLDHPCKLLEGGWTCDDLYVGQDADSGRRFEVALYDADAEAVAALRKYGSRDKTLPDSYYGLDALPGGLRELDSIVVTRR